jgi:hypothetical protein
MCFFGGFVELLINLNHIYDRLIYVVLISSVRSPSLKPSPDPYYHIYPLKLSAPSNSPHFSLSTPACDRLSLFHVPPRPLSPSGRKYGAVQFRGDNGGAFGEGNGGHHPIAHAEADADGGAQGVCKNALAQVLHAQGWDHPAELP